MEKAQAMTWAHILAGGLLFAGLAAALLTIMRLETRYIKHKGERNP